MAVVRTTVEVDVIYFTSEQYPCEAFQLHSIRWLVHTVHDGIFYQISVYIT
jgi:hypothetical protein